MRSREREQMPGADPRPTVVLVHGIYSNGNWYDPVERALDPFFVVKKVRYPHLRWLAVTKLSLRFVGGLLLLLAAPVGVVAAFWLPASYVLWIVGGQLLLGLGLFELTPFLHRRARRRVRMALLNAYARSGDRIHVIAHSYGTLLLGELLPFAPVLFGGIIVIGCVLPVEYDWSGVLRSHPEGRYEIVRNETGLEDRVVALASWASRSGITEGMGRAGVDGFATCDTGPALVHTFATCWGPCPRCKRALPVGSVHNAELDGYDHGSWFDLVDETNDHALVLWAPTLWHIQPVEYTAFVHACVRASRARAAQDVVAARALEDWVSGSEWSWTEDSSMAAYLERRLKVSLGSEDVPAGAVPSTMARMCQLVHASINRERADFAAYRNPQWAAARAVFDYDG